MLIHAFAYTALCWQVAVPHNLVVSYCFPPQFPSNHFQGHFLFQNENLNPHMPSASVRAHVHVILFSCVDGWFGANFEIHLWLCIYVCVCVLCCLLGNEVTGGDSAELRACVHCLHIIDNQQTLFELSHKLEPRAWTETHYQSTHTHTHARARARTHTHTHTHSKQTRPPIHTILLDPFDWRTGPAPRVPGLEGFPGLEGVPKVP